MIKIREYCRLNRINTLVHFTRVENLESIVEFGLFPVEVLSENNLRFKNNDPYRLDEALYANCLSFSYPNYKFFYTLRSNYPQREYCVIEFDSSVLWEKDCIFCKTNAASSEERDNIHGNMSDRRKLRELFYNPMLRLKLGLPTYYTTDPQAEVLVCDIIESRYIKSIHFNQKHIYNRFRKKHAIRKHNLIFSNEYYWGRKDYNYWQEE
jgi:hypothetical protein